MNTQLPSPPDPPEEPEELEAIARLLSPGGATRGQPSKEEDSVRTQPPKNADSDEAKPEPSRVEGVANGTPETAPAARRRPVPDVPTNSPPRKKRPAQRRPASAEGTAEGATGQRRGTARKKSSQEAPSSDAQPVRRKRKRVTKKPAEQSRAPDASPPAKSTASPTSGATSDSVAPATGHRIAGRFEIRGPLGEGPNGRVFRARDHAHSGRSTALKILHARHARASDFGERLDALFEARARLRSETINRLRQVGRTDLGLYFLATDPVAGENLRSLLDRRGPLHPRQAFEIVRQVAQGLAEGHAIGLVHGAVHDHNVFLLERIPSSDANPFAVGIRLSDFGLAGLFTEGASQPSIHDDLRELGWLLVELLSGTRPDPQGRGWEAGASTRLSPEGSAFVARSVGAEAPFPSAVALREALEALPDWKGDDPTLIRWRRMALGSAVAAVLLTGFLLWNAVRERSVQAAPDSGASAQDSVDSSAEIERLNRELSRLQTALEEARVATQASDRSTAAERLRAEALQSEIDELRQDLTAQQLKSQRAEATGVELEKTKTLLVESEQQARAWQRKAIDLENERDTERRARDPHWQAALGLDHILAALDARGAAGARAELERMRSSPTFSVTGFPGERFLIPWLTAAEELQAAVLATAPLQAARHVTSGDEALSAANAELATFEEDSAPWVGLGDATRMASLRQSLASLEDALSAERKYLEPRLVSAWEAVATPAIDRAPDAVVPLALWFGDGRLSPWVDDLATLFLEATDLGERLDVPALIRLEHLDAWAETLSAEPSLASRFSTDEIRLLRYARRFHHPDFTEEAVPPFVVRHQGPGGGSPVSGWRATLELKARLAGGELPYPAPVGTRSVWVTRTPEGSTSYVVETVQRDDAPPADATRSHIVEQRFYDGLGEKRGDRRIRVVQRGKRFFEEGVRQTLLLDLAQDAGFEVRYWTPKKEKPTPERLPVHGETITRFHKSLLERGWRTLVRVEGQRAAWFSPELGYVRDAEPGRIERELMLLELPPPAPTEAAVDSER